MALWIFYRVKKSRLLFTTIEAAIAQLGERQTEDLKVPGSIPGGGIKIFFFYYSRINLMCLCGAMDNASLS